MSLFYISNQVLILLILSLVGFLSRKLEIINESMIDNLSNFLLSITLPAMIISSMQKPYTPDLLKEIAIILFISLCVYTFTFLLTFIFPKIVKTKKEEYGVYNFMIMFSNVGFIGYPVLAAVFGEDSLFYGAIYNLPFNLLVFSLGIYMMVDHDNKNFNVKSIINPGIVAVFIGFILFITSTKLPHVINEPIIILGNLTTPLSMIFIGGSLSHIKIYEIFGEWRLYVMSLFRLIIIPLIVFFVLKLFTNDLMIIGVPVIITAMPVAANCAIIAKEYGGNADLASKGIFLSTLLSTITIPLIAYILF